VNGLGRNTPRRSGICDRTVDSAWPDISTARLRSYDGQPLEQLGPAHAGHHHVADDDVDGRAEPTTASPEGLGSVRRLEDDIAVGPQAQHRQAAHVRLVLDDEDGLGTGRHRAAAPPREGVGGAGLSRQVDAEGRALARLGVDADVAAHLPDDAMARGQAEARALAQLLGREERLEQVRPDLVGHADSGVGTASST
jgi:hypothetical protein